ncbi:hypothetical protein GE09DRAFT_767549 [Coniochaeta sp. 2T2.1]|nr:hypothetical protein GE09DRAFT_767549 [Coniochaeta sp. 2T2.1]
MWLASGHGRHAVRTWSMKSILCNTNKRSTPPVVSFEAHVVVMTIGPFPVQSLRVRNTPSLGCQNIRRDDELVISLGFPQIRTTHGFSGEAREIARKGRTLGYSHISEKRVSLAAEYRSIRIPFFQRSCTTGAFVGKGYRGFSTIHTCFITTCKRSSHPLSLIAAGLAAHHLVLLHPATDPGRQVIAITHVHDSLLGLVSMTCNPSLHFQVANEQQQANCHGGHRWNKQ